MNKLLVEKDELLDNGDKAALIVRTIEIDNLRDKSFFSRPMWQRGHLCHPRTGEGVTHVSPK